MARRASPTPAALPPRRAGTESRGLRWPLRDERQLAVKDVRVGVDRGEPGRQARPHGAATQADEGQRRQRERSACRHQQYTAVTAPPAATTSSPQTAQDSSEAKKAAT